MGKLYGAGINQGDLVDLLALIKTNFNGILTKLDNDSGVADTDYNSTLAVTVPSGIRTTGDKAIRDQGVVLTYLTTVITNFNAMLTKLDADATVNNTNYNSTRAITSTVGTKHIQNSGMDQGSLIYLLDQIITQINATNAKLDLDSGVNGTNYASLWNVSDTVIQSGAYA